MTQKFKFTLLFAAFSLTYCGGPVGNQETLNPLPSAPENSPSLPEVPSETSPKKKTSREVDREMDPGLPNLSDKVKYVDGWREVVIHGIDVQGYKAKVTVSVMAHYLTTRNACNREAYGALSLEDWNQFADAINSVTQGPPPGKKRCISVPSPMVDTIDETMDIVLSDEGAKRLNKPKSIRLFEFDAEEWGICTTIPDPALSDRLLALAKRVMLVAHTEDCAYAARNRH